MKLLSVNVSLPREVFYEGKAVRTGIFKQPVDGRVRLARLNLEGDAQGDLANHGGPDKAVYAYTFENYAYWAQQLRRDDFTPGQFGENLTVEEMPENEVCLGDVYRVGQAEVEVSQPRIPCFKLGLKMGLPDFPKRFLASGRLGFYLRVLEEGAVAAGDPIERRRAGPERVNIQDLVRAAYFEGSQQELLRRALRVPALSAAWREFLEQRLAAGPREDSTLSEK